MIEQEYQPRQRLTSRRSFLSGTAGLAAAAWLPALRGWAGQSKLPAVPTNPPSCATSGQAASVDLPRCDLHAHLDNSTIDAVASLGRKLGVRLGIVEHAGTKENVYPVVLSNDAELDRYLHMLEGKGVWRGVQAEWKDWTSGFSRAALARLDYVLMDAMTFPGKDGRRVKLWEKDLYARVPMDDRERFMDRFVDWHVEILNRQPIDILANVSWLPTPLAADYDAFWTPSRIGRVVEAAVANRVAIEISSGYRLPRPAFLRIAKAAGAKFSFGSNGRYPKMGKLDYALEMARQFDLKRADIFLPGDEVQKAVLRKSF